MDNQPFTMPEMTNHAQHALAIAKAESHTYRQQMIGTEHLLLGLIRTEGSAAARVLASFNVSVSATHDAIELLAGHGKQRHPSQHDPLNLTQRTQETLELAEHLRHALGHTAVDTEHLLFALLDIPGNAALGVLQTLGVEREQLRNAVSLILRPVSRSDKQREAIQLTHLDARGQAHMVDVGAKAETQREAIARGSVVMQAQTLELITSGTMPKGDVLATARIAGIMAAKQTSQLIPLCHPLMLTHVGITISINHERSTLDIEAIVRTSGKTGVEMEALTAVSVAALTIYDMCKAVDRTMQLTNIRLAQKRGGKSGEIVLEE